MKKIFIYTALLLSATASKSQVEVTATTFDLETEKLHKYWKFFPGYITPNGETVVKMGRTVECDVEKGFASKTYKGVKWDFTELKFDKDLNYINKEVKSFDNTMKALDYAPVFGKVFNPEASSITDGGGVLGITTDYLNTKSVVPTITLTNFKISSFSFYGQVKTDLEGKYCWEAIMSKKENSILAKEEKDQKWIAQTAYHYPGGGDILFATSGVYPEKNIAHYVFKRYNGDLEVEKELYLPFDFNANFKVIPIDKKGGIKDYVIVAQAGERFKSKKYAGEVPLADPDIVEVIYINGETFDIKYRATSKLKYSMWNVSHVIESEKGIYIVGAAGADAVTRFENPGYTGFHEINMGKQLLNIPEQLPNYQILSVDNTTGKIEWVNGISKEEATPLVTVLSGIDLKAKATPIFTVPNNTLQNTSWGAKANFVNDKIVISFQQMLKPGSYSKPAEDRGNMVTMIFDNKGNMKGYFIKPEETYAAHDIYFSKDNKKMYWANYELNELNDIPTDNGVGALSKKVKSTFAANLHLVVFDLDQATTEGIQHIGKDKWAIAVNYPVVVDSDDAVVFEGRTLSKKAKDSELVLIKVKK